MSFKKSVTPERIRDGEDEILHQSTREAEKNPRARFAKAAFSGVKFTMQKHDVMDALANDWARNRTAASGDALFAAMSGPISQLASNTAGYLKCPHLLEDLVAEGRMQLFQAADNYDHTSGHFIHYASCAIKGSMIHFCHAQMKTIRIGTTQGERWVLARLPRMLTLFREIFDRDISQTAHDIAWLTKTIATNRTSPTEHTVQIALGAHLYRMETIEDARDELVETPEEDNNNRIASGETRRILSEEIFSLIHEEGHDRRPCPRRQDILRQIARERPINHGEMARRFGITPERVGQIKRDVLTDIRVRLKRRGITSLEFA